ncbi:MAG: sigma-70 family RNA polymerase sigma factor [Sedimentisphaerales bacterium]|nr:sigma-70 family RNA polymerase sigma factor [Sedimentisphaerales bacterium]
MQEDKQLISRFNRGDEDALRHIYEKYRDDLFKVAGALLNDRIAVEDVVHDVFVSFASSAGKFRLRGSLKGYFSICAANRARDFNRTMQRQDAVVHNESESVFLSTDEPAHSAIGNELSEQLNYAMARIPSEQREVIILHIQSNLGFKEIAKSTGVSVNTVQGRYRYGLDKLRSLIAGELKE